MPKASEILEKVEKYENNKKKFGKPLKYRKEVDVDNRVIPYGKRDKEEDKEDKKLDPKAEREKFSYSLEMPLKDEEDDEPEPIANQEVMEEDSEQRSRLKEFKDYFKGLTDEEDRDAMLSFGTSVVFYGVSLNLAALSIFGASMNYYTWLGWGLGAWILENKLLVPLTKILTSNS
ncbi:MAG: hypothetical protein ACOCTT_00785 [archaeon]